MANSPAFQYYPADMATDPICRFWTMEQMGCYHAMIDFLWLNSGKLEQNSSEFPAKLCGIFRVSHQKRAQKLFENVSKKFDITDGLITHRRVTKEMQKQAQSRLKRSEAGKKGMKKRWEPDNSVIPETITNDNPSSSTSSSSSTSVKYSENSDEFRLADYLFKHIQRRKPDFKKPNIQSWAKNIDLMIRVDKRKPDKIKEIVKWCQEDEFWLKNILSTTKLRKQFDRLEMQSESDGQTAASNNRKPQKETEPEGSAYGHSFSNIEA